MMMIVASVVDNITNDPYTVMGSSSMNPTLDNIQVFA